MTKQTLKIFLVLLGLYGLLWLPGIFIGEKYFETTPLGALALFPVLSLYLFGLIGIPGLLDNPGGCGWGWCRSPTTFGLLAITAFWLGVLWLISRRIAICKSKKSSNDSKADM